MNARRDYIGTHPPCIAEPRPPMRVIHMRRSGDHILLSINDAGNLRLIRVRNPDDTRLQALGADDRSRVHSAVLALAQRAGGEDDS